VAIRNVGTFYEFTAARLFGIFTRFPFYVSSEWKRHHQNLGKDTIFFWNCHERNRRKVESMTHIVRRLEEEKQLKAYFEFQIVEGFAGNMLWDKGTLIYRRI
jgi:hypothetical protein